MSPLDIATGGTDTSNTVLNSTTSKQKTNFYSFKFESKMVIDREYPIKYWEKKVRLCEFKDNFPDIDLKKLKKAHEAKTDQAKKDACRRVFAELPNYPALNSVKSLLPEIKKISGCDLSLRYQRAISKNFSEVKKSEKIATFYCSCRNRQCGIKTITIAIFLNKAEIRFEPKTPTDDVE